MLFDLLKIMDHVFWVIYIKCWPLSTSTWTTCTQFCWKNSKNFALVECNGKWREIGHAILYSSFIWKSFCSNGALFGIFFNIISLLTNRQNMPFLNHNYFGDHNLMLIRKPHFTVIVSNVRSQISLLMYIPWKI